MSVSSLSAFFVDQIIPSSSFVSRAVDPEKFFRLTSPGSLKLIDVEHFRRKSWLKSGDESHPKASLTVPGVQGVVGYDQGAKAFRSNEHLQNGQLGLRGAGHLRGFKKNGLSGALFLQPGKHGDAAGMAVVGNIDVKKFKLLGSKKKLRIHTGSTPMSWKQMHEREEDEKDRLLTLADSIVD